MQPRLIFPRAKVQGLPGVDGMIEQLLRQRICYCPVFAQGLSGQQQVRLRRHGKAVALVVEIIKRRV